MCGAQRSTKGASFSLRQYELFKSIGVKGLDVGYLCRYYKYQVNTKKMKTSQGLKRAKFYIYRSCFQL